MYHLSILVEVATLVSASLNFVDVEDDVAIEDDAEELLEAGNCGTIMQY